MAGTAEPRRPRYTWTCTDCPAWAGQHWHTESEAADAKNAAAAEHALVCPSGGHLVVLGDPVPGHPEQHSAAQLIGSYDSEELFVVPAWAVHTAAALAGLVANYADRGIDVDFANPNRLRAIVGPIWAADPQPDQPNPATRQELAERLRHLRTTLTSALPHPWPARPPEDGSSSERTA